MTWHKLTLSPSDVVAGAQSRITQQFDAAFFAAQGPADMALFSSDFVASDNLTLYFSPATEKYARALLMALGAQPTERPTEKVALSVGHADALARFRKNEI